MSYFRGKIIIIFKKKRQKDRYKTVYTRLRERCDASRARAVVGCPSNTFIWGLISMVWIRWRRRGACSFLISYRALTWRKERWGCERKERVDGGRLVRAASSVSGARTHDGELITHIISPQIDAASCRNWRLSCCLGTDISVSLLLCVGMGEWVLGGWQQRMVFLSTWLLPISLSSLQGHTYSISLSLWRISLN